MTVKELINILNSLNGDNKVMFADNKDIVSIKEIEKKVFLSDEV